MLYAPVFIFTSGSSALLGHPCCGLSIWLSLLAIFNTIFRVYILSFFNEKMDETQKWDIQYNAHGCIIIYTQPTKNDNWGCSIPDFLVLRATDLNHGFCSWMLNLNLKQMENVRICTSASLFLLLLFLCLCVGASSITQAADQRQTSPFNW